MVEPHRCLRVHFLAVGARIEHGEDRLPWLLVQVDAHQPRMVRRWRDRAHTSAVTGPAAALRAAARHGLEGRRLARDRDEGRRAPACRLAVVLGAFLAVPACAHAGGLAGVVPEHELVEPRPGLGHRPRAAARRGVVHEDALVHRDLFLLVANGRSGQSCRRRRCLDLSLSSGFARSLGSSEPDCSRRCGPCCPRSGSTGARCGSASPRRPRSPRSGRRRRRLRRGC